MYHHPHAESTFHKNFNNRFLVTHNSSSNRCEEGTTKQLKVIRCKPDLRLAESYVPAALLIFKGLFYTFMVPIIACVEEYWGLIVVAFFLMLLYVDHIYFVIPTVVFIDTTAVSLDVVMSTLCMLLLGAFPGQSYPWACIAVLSIWGCCGGVYILTMIGTKKNTLRPAGYKCMAHIIAFLSLLLFILMWMVEEGPSQHTSQNITSSLSGQGCKIANKMIHPFHYFLRNLLYIILILVDSYSFRPLFQQENERIFFCKYGAILFAYDWQFTALFFGCMLAIQILRVSHYVEWMTEGASSSSFHNEESDQDMISNSTPTIMVVDNAGGVLQGFFSFGTSLSEEVGQGASSQEAVHHHEGHNVAFQPNGTMNSSTPTTNHIQAAAAVVDQDVMEAFRIAKQQYHGGKTN